MDERGFREEKGGLPSPGIPMKRCVVAVLLLLQAVVANPAQCRLPNGSDAPCGPGNQRCAPVNGPGGFTRKDIDTPFTWNPHVCLGRVGRGPPFMRLQM